MIFTLIVQASPYQHQAPETALRFAKALLNQGHSLHRVFFYRDGVHSASSLAVSPRDEQNIPEQWQALAEAHQLDLVVCIAAAIRRGVIDAGEAKRYERHAHNLHPAFELSGLGQLVEASLVSDRVITFGG